MPEVAPKSTAEGPAEAIVANIVASGIGAIVKTAADRLIAPDQFTIKTIVAFEDAFVLKKEATIPEFLPDCIFINVGPRPLGIQDSAVPDEILREQEEYKLSPVVVRLQLLESKDGTALSGLVTHWKYLKFLNPKQSLFRKPKHKVTIDVKVSNPDGSVLLTVAIQIEADVQTLPHFRPNGGERLPWVPRPIRNFTGIRKLDEQQLYGPVNIEASITEVAEPSEFAKIIGAALSSQKAAIESLVKDRANQALDPSTAAKGRLAALKDASNARDDYTAAYNAAAGAKNARESTSDPVAKNVAQQDLVLKLATLRQKEAIARDAFNSAGITFEPLSRIDAA